MKVILPPKSRKRRVLRSFSAVFAGLLAALSNSAEASGTAEVIHALYGPPHCVAATGNGRLTVGFDKWGRVSVCRWPHPSHYEHAAYRMHGRDTLRPGVAPESGMTWGVRMPAGVWWPHMASAGVRQTYTACDSVVIECKAVPGAGTEFVQTWFVHPHMDLLVSQCRVRTGGNPVSLLFYENTSPNTKQVRSIPVPLRLLGGSSDFAVFSSPDGRVYHFAPGVAGTHEFSKALHLAELADRAKIAAWEDFGEGVWLGFASQQPPASLRCGPAWGEKSVWRRTTEDWLTPRGAAAGDCASVMTFPQAAGAGAVEVTLFVAFGPDKNAVDDILDAASERGYSALLEETRSRWRQRIGRAALPRDRPMADAAKRCLVTMWLCADPETGGIVRSCSRQSVMSVDWLRYSFEVAHSLRMAGFSQPAHRHWEFWSTDANRTPGPFNVFRVYPPSRYTNGAPATPRFLHDVAALARFLQETDERIHAAASAERKELLESAWPLVFSMAEALCIWRDGRTGGPMHAFNPPEARDTASQVLASEVYLGLKAATRVAELKGSAPEAWGERLAELDALLLSAFLDSSGQWAHPQPLLLWGTGLLPVDDPRWPEAVDLELANIQLEDRFATARALDRVTGYLSQDPSQGKRRAPRLKQLLLRVMPCPLTVSPHDEVDFPDALHAALCYRTALRIDELSR